MTDRGRGGQRQPQRPAAVSGPSGLSARTDGGAGSQRQPIRVPKGGDHGDRKALTEQQQAAPLAAGGAPQAPGAPGGAAVAGPNGAFGPSTRPNEPIMAGVPTMDQAQPDTKAVLRMIYDRYPSPWIGALFGD